MEESLHPVPASDVLELAEACVNLLRQQELTVTTAESCTGGLLSSHLVDVPGVSEVCQQGHS